MRGSQSLVWAVAAVLVVAQGARGVEITLTGQTTLGGLVMSGASDASVAIPVDAASKLDLVVLSASPLEMSLTLPGGAIVSPAAPGPARFRRVTLAAPPAVPAPGFGIGEHVVISLEDPPAGEYSLRVSLPSPPAVAFPFLVTVLPRSELRVALSVPEPELLVGEAATISALIFEGSEPVTGATVSAVVTEENAVAGDAGSSQELELLDDGEGADAAVGDGIYTGAVAPAQPGHYLVSARLTGSTTSGAPFRRDAGSAFDISAPTSRFTGSFTSSTVDAEGNQRPDALRVTLAVELATAGEYAIGLVLRAGNGKKLGTTTTDTFAAGSQSVAVDFAALNLRDFAEGPYALEVAQLYEVTPSGRRLRDRRTELGSVAGIPLQTLEGFRGLGDLDGDGDVDANDLGFVLEARNQPAYGPEDPRDLNGDGMITAFDARRLTLLCTRPRCAQ